MKKQIKAVIGVSAALALVIVLGTTLSDHALKATDGEENIVEEVVVEEPVLDEVEEENPEVIIGEAVEPATEEEQETEEAEETETEEAEETKTESSLDTAEGKVSITSNIDLESPIEAGTKVTLTAEVEGFEGIQYHLQWSRSTDGENWEDIEGANSEKFTFEMDEETSGYMWRVRMIEE